MKIKNIKNNSIYDAELNYFDPDIVFGIITSIDKTEVISVVGKMEGKILKLYNNKRVVSYYKTVNEEEVEK